ncbi:phosphotransferase [Roseovarius aestuariivivens]|uniref:phosphotransferase n=1 Tax=Roseovarius aestuariivivens TaxID=1888910 RepID=UPI001436B1AC|nr:phosphotransferase [Roseovarius aestuariivivens]
MAQPDKTGDTPPALPDLAALEAVQTRLMAAAEEAPALAPAEPYEVIRYVEGKRAVLRGRLGEEAAIFRIYFGDTGACARDWAELRRVWPMMCEGDAQVCTPLAHAPRAGVLAVAEVSGTPLLQHFYAIDPPERAQWLQPAARWLRAYTESSESEVDAAPGGWLTRAERAAKAQAFNRLRRVERPILEELKRLAPTIDGGKWRAAISHGDFHPNNLIAAGTRLTGIDCGGSRPLPIYKDMARFLMHMGRRGMIPSGRSRFGVDADGLDAMAESFALTDRERRLILPFFLGIEALIRAETRKLSNSRVRRARAMSEALLTDLQQIRG